MPRGKKNHHDSDSVSDPSDGDFDSDDSMRDSHKPKKKVVRKEQTRARPAPKKASPRKKKRHDEDEEEEAAPVIDEDEDDEQRKLIEHYDEEDLLNIKVPDAPAPCMASDGGDRLMITDIWVDNFKSYYGPKRLGPFHHSFTSIIGPNGSGKSNVIDALLFVFGAKASKIRSKKVSVLIHSSAGKDDIQSCSVKICFQKIIDKFTTENDKKKYTGEFDIVPGSAFNVQRTAYRNNSSEYKLNGTRTTFKDVAARLKTVGIDLKHNRFLILQGEVEQIALMKPKSVNGVEEGMLEYLEDIIGSSRYKIPIDTLSAKLDKLTEERSSQMAKVNQANEEKKALDEPVRRTIAYHALQNKTQAYRAKQALKEKYDAEVKIEELKPAQRKMEAELAKENKDLVELQVTLRDKQQEVEQMSRELVQLNDDCNKTFKELQSIMQRYTKLKNDEERGNKEMKKLGVEMKKEKEALEKVKKAPEEAKLALQQLAIQLAEYREEQQTAQQQYDENYPKFNKKTEADRAKKLKLEEEYSSYAARLAEAESKCKLATASLATMMEEFEKKTAALNDLQKTLTENEKLLAKEKKTKDEVTLYIASKIEERNAARAEMEVIDAKTDVIKQRLAELAPMFTEKHQEAETRRSYNLISNTFEDAVKKGKMKGYIGRMGDLGTVPPEYDKAISTNFAGNLDLYLVERYETVKEGIALLKGLGKQAKFLQLDRTTTRDKWDRIEALEKEKEGPVKRLFNQIKCEHRLKPAFFHCVSTSYVVPNIDDATAFVRKMRTKNSQPTVVTLDGSMIDHRGNYIGGGTARTGKIGTGQTAPPRRESSMRDDEATANRLRQAQEEKNSLERDYQDYVKRKRFLEIQINNLAHPLQERERLSKELDRKIRTLEDRIKFQRSAYADLEKEAENAKVDEKELDSKRAEIDKLSEDRDNVAEESRTFQRKVKDIEAEMTKVFNKLVKKHKDTLDNCKAEIARIEKEESAARAVINSADRNLAKQQARMEELEAEVDKKRHKNITLQETLSDYSKSTIHKTNLHKTLGEQKEELEKQLKLRRDEVSVLDRQETVIEANTKRLSEHIRDKRRHINGLIARMDQIDIDIAGLSLNNMTEILAQFPEDERESLQSARVERGGASSDDETDESDDENASMNGSPKKRKRSKERRKKRMEGDEEEEDDDEGKKKRKKKEKEKKNKRQSDSPSKKRRRTVEGDEEDAAEEGQAEQREEQNEEEGEEERDEGQEMETGEDHDTSGDASAAAGDDEGEEQEEEGEQEEEQEDTPEQREERRARRMQARRDRQQQRVDDLQNGVMPRWSRRAILKLDQAGLAQTIETLERHVSKMAKQLTPHVLVDYKRKVDKLRSEGSSLTAITERHNAHRVKLEELKRFRLADFTGGFASISQALRELYQMITMGGDASLELRDVMDPFLEGVQFMVRPPKKSWKQIENLSGGEKTLSSLALVFALHKYRPTPLYVMDEIDAALDFRNVSIIGNYISERTKNAQFIIISLRNNMFELADRLIGIYKVHDCTNNVVVDPKKVLAETEVQRKGLLKMRQVMDSNKNTTGVGYGG